MKFLTRLSQRKLYRIILCLVIAVFLLINRCAFLAGEAFSWKLDMTGEKLYELSAVTKEVGQGLSGETDLFVVSGEKDYPSMFREMLSRYAGLSPYLTVSYVDPFENPLFVDNYKQQGYTLSPNDVVVSGKNGIRQIAYDEMLVYTGEEVSGISIEQQVTAAILYVNSSEKSSVAFTSGHGERTTKALQNVFTNNNYEVKNIALTSGGAVDADILVIASPARDFEPLETEALEAHLAAGRKLMVFLEPGVGLYPNLSTFLKKWNLEPENNVVFEERAYASDNPINVIPMYKPHSINVYFVKNPYYVVMPASRGIKVLKDADNIKTLPVLSSTEASYAKDKLQYDLAAWESGDAKGPFVLAATAEKTIWTEEGEKTAAIFLAGSRNMYADDIMAVESYANSEFLTQVMNFLTQSTGNVYIPAKTLAKPPLPVTMRSSLMIGSVLVVILPLGFIGAGIRVYRKRKNL